MDAYEKKVLVIAVLLLTVSIFSMITLSDFSFNTVFSSAPAAELSTYAMSHQ